MNIVVTLVNEPYIEQAKQFFASLFFAGKWHEHCMIITDIADQKKTDWFARRGIIVNYQENAESNFLNNYSSIVGLKLHLFDQRMKRWDKVIFMDTDIIVRKPIKPLVKLSGFNVSAEVCTEELIHQFINPISITEHLKSLYMKKKYDTYTRAFNTGVIVFSTDIITMQTYKELSRLLSFYKPMSLFGEQGIFNLFWYKRWYDLPKTFNYRVNYDPSAKKNKSNPIVLHFGGGTKPWDKSSPYYREWKANLKKADLISFPLPTL